MTYRLYLSFIALDDWSERTEELIKLVGTPSSGSGMGFGMRDVDFEFGSKIDRKAAVERVLKKFPDVKVTLVDDKGSVA